MKIIITKTLAAIALATMIAGSPIGAATAEEEFSDSKLTAFAAAAIQVQAIVARWTPQVEAAESEQKKAEIISSAEAEMVNAVEGTPDITVEEYNEIVEAARSDPKLSARIEELGSGS